MTDALNPGIILHLFFGHINPQKFKLVVLVCVEPHVSMFFINSRKSKFVQDNADLDAAYLPIRSDQHRCLDHDSFIDCTETRDLIRHVEHSSLLPQKKIEWILEALSPTRQH